MISRIPETELQALLISAEHWLQNFENPAAATIESSNCACSYYADISDVVIENTECGGCPIYNHTKIVECENTPYENARTTILNYRASVGTLSEAEFWCGEEYEFIMNLALNTKPRKEDFEYDYDGG